jgi:hypothetical protein
MIKLHHILVDTDYRFHALVSPDKTATDFLTRVNLKGEVTLLPLPGITTANMPISRYP